MDSQSLSSILQGKIGELDLYKLLRASGEPSPLLRIAESWLRAELDQKRAEKVQEEADGPAAIQERDPNQSASMGGGGFVAGRMAAYDVITR